MPARLNLAVLSSGRQVPSARFRIHQHLSPLANYGIECRHHCPRISRYARFPGFLGRISPRYLGPLGVGLVGARTIARIPGVLGSRYADATWLERELVRTFYSFEGLLKRPLFFDIDDAIWLQSPFATKIAAKSDCVIAGNSYIADWASQHCSNVTIVPTALDTEKFRPPPERRTSESFTIGWTGSSGNLKYLYDIERALAMFFSRNTDARLNIVCDQQPSFRHIPPRAVRHIAWCPETEATALWDFDVGIMPLRNTDWERGKCSFKLIQYMATGLPSVVSPVGMNGEILSRGNVAIAAETPADWTDILEALKHDAGLRYQIGRAARKLAVSYYSRSVITAQLANIFLPV